VRRVLPGRAARAIREGRIDAVMSHWALVTPRLARAVEGAGLTWIGPPPAAIELMGAKTTARERMQAAGVPIIPGTTEPVDTVAEVVRLGEELGYPLLIKAAAGGGGKGMKVVEAPDEVERAFEAAQREGQAYFANPSVYVERYLVDPRHVEVQVLADAHENVIHLGERDCTIQRRHQKLVEETPSPAVDAALRERIGQIAVDAARAADYRSAGTIEGLLTTDGEYFFMEMNTRIQVEHTVTELVTGLDLVREQVRIAAGEPLSVRQEDVRFSGHAIECRINAEDASKKFAPAPGRITRYVEPGGPGVRVDSGVEAGSEITPLYDPMIAKLIVSAVNREAATARMLRALDEFEIEGVTTLIPFHKALLRSKQWRRGETCRDLIEDPKWLKSLEPEPAAPAEETTEDEEKVERDYTVEVSGRRFDVKVIGPPAAPDAVSANSAGAKRSPRRERAGARGATQDGASEILVSPLQGTVLRVNVSKGEQVESGTIVCVIEAMKMENEITAHRSGKVEELNVSEGSSIGSGEAIAVIK